MRILVNRKPVSGPWGGGNLFVKAFCEYFEGLGHEVVHDFNHKVDVMFMQDPRYSDLGISINEMLKYKQSNPGVGLIHRVNECDARKGTSDMDSLLRECSKFTNLTIFVSNWMEEYHRSRGWHCKNTSVVYNGVNLDHFKKRPRIKNGKTNIVTHHWSDNPLKGADVYNYLDEFVGENRDDYTFTYIGRSGVKFKNSNLIPPLSGEDLGKELSRYDVYVSGSRHDPGPNHVIESVACEIPTLCHRAGGGALEFCGTHMSYNTHEELVSLIKNIKTKTLKKNTLEPYSWTECMKRLELAIFRR